MAASSIDGASQMNVLPQAYRRRPSGLRVCRQKHGLKFAALVLREIGGFLSLVFSVYTLSFLIILISNFNLAG